MNIKAYKKILGIVVISFFFFCFHSAVVEASELPYRLRGLFLLQADDKGQIWYLDSDNSLRHYLPSDYSSFLVLKDLSLGISNSNLAKIPVAIDSRFVRFDQDSDGIDDRVENALGMNPQMSDSDGDSYSDALEISQHFNPLGKGRAEISSSFSDSLKGKILMQVENNGELWYLNPRDGLRYYISDLEDLERVYKYLGQGIVTKDLELITKASLIDPKAKKSIRVDVGKAQRLYYYLGDIQIGSFSISAGKASTPTPKGEFKIINKSPKAWSSYGLWMPYWLGVGTGKFGFHELPIWPNGFREGENHLGIPVSHGCMRLGIGPAQFLYNWAEIGTPVSIF